MKSIAIIGGGAAGCFCAIETKRLLPDALVRIYESQDRLLAKVSVTGGGRCNLTNSFEDYKDSNGKLERLEHVYPRGHRLMKRLFNVFSPEDTVKWYRVIHDTFEKHEISRSAWSYRRMDFGLSDERMDGVRDRLIPLL